MTQISQSIITIIDIEMIVTLILTVPMVLIFVVYIGSGIARDIMEARWNKGK